MTLKSYIKINKIHISNLQRETNIPYSTISDIINGKTNIDNSSVGVFMKLSKALNVGLEDFYIMAKETVPVPENDKGFVLKMIKGKYYIIYKNIKKFLCINNEVNAYYIEEITQTFINNQLRKERMDSWMTII